MKGLGVLGLLLFLGVGSLGAQAESSIFEANFQNLLRLVEPHSASVRSWVKSVLTDKPETRAEYLTCDVCGPAAALIRPFVETVTEEEFVRLIGKLCEVLHLAPSDDICIPTIGSYAKPVLYIVKNRKNVTNDDFCGIINPDCAKNVNPIYLNWTIAVDANKPETPVVPPLDAGVAAVNILQFTDIHLDLDYVEGTSADCPYPICCRESNGVPPSPNMTAGPFGHYRCGLPTKGLDAIFSDAKARYPAPKFIFLTGDYVHSGVWLYSAEENGRHIWNVTNRLAAMFPDTKIYPITGNHETDICNMYPPTSLQALQPEFSLKWMYNATSFNFKDSMTDEAVAKFMEAGFYTVVPEVGLRLVILNTNLCYVQNFWLPYEPRDPEDQLKWFSETMLEAESKNENVYLIAHISPGSGSCWPVWSEQYNRIIKRYSHLIRGQFHGHSHNEFFVVTFDDDKTPITTSYVGPSAVTDSMNPGYKAYHVDGARATDSTWEIMDHETWILDLDKSNAQNVAEFFKEYSAKETFGLTSLRPNDHWELVKKMATDLTLFEKFHVVYAKSSKVERYQPCTDAACVSGVLCNTVVANSADLTYCTEIEKMVEQTFAGETSSTTENGSISIISSVYALYLSVIVIKFFSH